MPFANEHSARLRSPKGLEPKSFRRNDSPVFGKKLPEGVEVIWAKFVGKSALKDSVVPQAIRFPKDKYSVAQAKKWLDDNEVRVSLFEPAKAVKESILEELEDISKYIVGISSDSDLKEDLKTTGKWYSDLKTKDESKHTEEEISKLAESIIKEMVERDRQKFHPENWKNKPMELYSNTFKKLKEDGFEVPENVNKYLSSLEESKENSDKNIQEQEKGKKQLDEELGKFTLRFKWRLNPESAKIEPSDDSNFELLIDTGKDVLDRWVFGRNFFGFNVNPEEEIKELTATKKTLNIQTPEGNFFKEWMNWGGAIPPKDARLKEVFVLSKVKEPNAYIVRDKQDNHLLTKKTIYEFEIGKIAYLDQFENLYKIKKGGIVYGNMHEGIPMYVDIKDSGNVKIIDFSDKFISFKFENSMFLYGYWVMTKESLESDTWIFSKGESSNKELKEEDNISSTGILEEIKDSFSFSGSTPIEIHFKEDTYILIPTKNDKLILNKK